MRRYEITIRIDGAEPIRHAIRARNRVAAEMRLAAAYPNRQIEILTVVTRHD